MARSNLPYFRSVALGATLNSWRTAPRIGVGSSKPNGSPARREKRRFRIRNFARQSGKSCSGKSSTSAGGVFKKRLGKNRFRSIILAKGGRNWVYEYLFAKKDLDNISQSDLARFRKLARSYEGLTDREIVELVANQDWVEISE